MTIEETLKSAAAHLQDNGYIHGEREAQIFLAHILDTDTNELFRRYEENLDAGLAEQFDEAVTRRLKGEPVAYIVGNQQFMGWTLLSDNRALIPRPETEQLVELLVKEIRNHKLESGHFLEIGTGAGPIAISLKKYFPAAEIIATDISEEALELAQKNAERLKVDVKFIESDLFNQVTGKFDLIVANLPYVPTQKLAFVSDQILDHEPMIAIEAGEDGMKYIDPFIQKLGDHLAPNGIAAIEMWHTHGELVQELLAKHLPDYEAEIHKDLAGFDRFAVIAPK